MARSLGLNRVPTLDPKGEGEYPSYEYVRSLVRALNSNFEILNSAFGGSRQDTTDLGTIYQATGTALSVINSYTQLVALNLTPGIWFVMGKGSHFDQNGNTTREAQLFNFTASTSFGHTQDFDAAANMRASFCVYGTHSSDVDWNLRLEAKSGNAAGVRTVDDVVLIAWKIQEVI